MTVKKSFLYLGIIAIVLLILISIFSKKEPTVEYTTVKVEKGTIVQTVNETGTVKSDQGIDLSFSSGGKLEKLDFAVGDKVKKGDLLATLDYSNLVIKRNEAFANLDVAKQSLNKLLSGASTEEILVSKASVDQSFKQYESAKKELDKVIIGADEANRQAQKNLSDLESDSADTITSTEYSVDVAETNLENTKKTYQNFIDNYTTSAISLSDDKITTTHNALDAIDEILNDEDGEDYIGIKDRSQLNLTKNNYLLAQTAYNEAKSNYELVEIDKSNSNIQKLVTSAINALSKTFDSLSSTYVSLENSITGSTFKQTDIDTFKSIITTQQTSISSAIQTLQGIEQNLNKAILDYNTNVRAAENSLTSAKTVYKNALKDADNNVSTTKISGESKIVAAESKVNNAFQAWQVAQAQFKQLTASANKYDIKLAEAKIKQADAALNAVKKQIEDSVIVSPINGIITELTYEIGEQITPNTAVISLITQKKFEIEVMITETDISKIKIGDKAIITLDTFGEDIKFYGKVYFIDPAETQIDGVIYYKNKIEFDTDERAIKSGMTANVSIVTAEIEDATFIANRALIRRDDKGIFARILKGDIVEEKKVEVGLYGDGGMVEVLSGVEEGEEAITYIKQ